MIARSHTSISSLLLLALLVVLSVEANAQFRVGPVRNIGDSIVCHVGGQTYKRTPNKDLIYRISYAPTSTETQAIFEKIAEYTELRSNVYTVPVTDEDVNVEICPGDVNYIAYNPNWLKSMYEETSNLWAIYAIIAHEIGHYSLAHDRKSVGSIPRLELEADEYAGEILAKMGACLSDAQAAYHAPVMQHNERSHTHPPIADRLAAVRRGWERFGRTCGAPEVSLPQVEITIDVYGQLNTIYLRPAVGITTGSGQFVFRNQHESKTIYLSAGQGAFVNLFGQNNKIIISRQVFDRVRVSESGQNNRVIVE